MKSTLTTAAFFIYIITICQNVTDIKPLNTKYQEIKTKNEKSHEKIKVIKKHYSALPNFNFTTAHNSTFGIQHSNHENYTKLNAAILFALSNCANYEFVADLFDQSLSNQVFVLKEMLKISLYSIPDTSSFKINTKEILNNTELLIQYDFNKTLSLREPIQVIYFSSVQETPSGLKKSKKIKIMHNNIVIYESNKKNNLLKSYQIRSNSDFNNDTFYYKKDDYKLQIKGGLWNHLITQKLKDISHQIFESSTYVKQVNDLYSDLNKDLKRSTSKGKTEPKQIKLDDIFSRNFESIITLELENSNEKIIEWHNRSQKKSELNLHKNIKNGFYKNWSKNGVLIKEAYYKDGLLEGTYKEFFPNHSPKVISYYKEGKIAKYLIEYFVNGNIAKKFKYKKGSKHGNHKIYYNNGTLKRKGKYKKNQPQGWHTFYNSEGNKIKKCKFKNGILKKKRL